MYVVIATKIVTINKRIVMKAPEYVLFSAAKDLLTDSDHLAYSDLFDRRLVNEKTLELLINALRIKRFGFKWCVAAEE